jgi:hypothetical protein
MLGTLAVGALALAGCSSGTESFPLSHGDQLTSKACKDIVTTMTPHTGTVVITLNFQELVVAVHDSPNARLHSELAAFQYHAAHPASGANYLSDASAMLRTCKQLGFGGSGGE